MADSLGRIEYEVGADNDPLRREILESEAFLTDAFRRMDKLRARPEIDAETRQVMQDIAETRAALLALERKQTTLKVDGRAFKRVAGEIKQAKRDLEDLSQRKYELSVESRQWRDADRNIKEVNKSLNDNQIQNHRAADAVRKHEAQVAKLREQYAKLQREQRTLSAKRFPDVDTNRRLETLNKELEYTAHRVRSLGGSVDDIDVDIDHHNGILRRWGASISNIRVHLGVASLTLRQFGVVLTTLGPIIEGLVGSAAALVGSLGAGLMGAATVGAAGLTAFGITTIGLVQAVQPAMAELKNLTAGFAAVTEAEQQYGKGSKEVREAQKELNEMLKNSDPMVARFAKTLNAMGTEWQRMTGSTRRDFFGMMTSGARGLQDMLPMLARNLNETMAVARKGAEDWIDTFSSPAAQAKIDNLLGNFTSSLPSFMAGIGNLAEAFLNTISEASNSLDSLGGGFEQWTQGLLRTTQRADFGSTVEGWIDSMRSLGHFLQSTGQLMTSFFGAGKKAGDGLLETMSATFDRWSAGMRTVEGRNDLADFFQRSSEMAQRFFSALGPVLEIIFNIAQITAPITSAMLEITEAIAEVVTGFMSLDGVRPLLSAFATAVAGAFVVGRVLAFAGAIRGVLAMMGLMRAAAIPSMAAGIAASMGGVAASTAAAGKAATGFKGAMGGMLASINPVATGLVALGTAAFIAEMAWQDRQKQLHRTQQTLGVMNTTLSDSIYLETDLGRAFEDQAQALRERDKAWSKVPGALRAAKSATNDLRVAEEAYHEAVRRFGPRSEQAYRALLRVRTANTKDAEASHRANERLTGNFREQGEAIDAARESLAAANDELRDSRKRMTEGPTVAGGLRGSISAAAQDTATLTDELDQQADAELLLAQAQNTRWASLMNIGRIMQGLPEVTGRAAQELGEFARKFRGVPAAKRLIMTTNSKQAVGELSAVANQARNISGRRAVIRILADSGSAQEAIARLQRLVERTTQRQWRVAVGIVDRVSSPLAQIAARLLGVSRKNYTAKLDADEDGAVSAYEAVTGLAGRWDGSAWQAAFSATTGSVASAFSAAWSTGLRWAAQTFSATFGVNNQAGKAQGGPLGGVPGFAQGADERLMKRAMSQADRRAPRGVGGGARLTKPTYITAEESGHPEYVIATNPAYRSSNRNYLAAAANDLGMTVVDGFKKGGPLFGPRSEYEQMRHQIQLSESQFSNMQRHFEEQLALGARYPQPDLPDLIQQKRGTLRHVDNLLDHINDSMIKRLRRTSKTRVPKVPKKPKEPKAPKADAGQSAQRNYQQAMDRYRKDLNRWEERKSKRDQIKGRKNEARDQIPDMRRVMDDLKQERYGYELDLESLIRGDVGGGGGGTGGPTLEEQFGSFNQARFDLFKTMGGNFTPLAAGFGSRGASGFAVTQSGGGTLSAPAATLGGGGSGTGGEAARSTQQTFINNFAAPPPDAHTWSQELEWEAGAAAG